MKTVYNQQLNETVYYATSRSGVEVAIVPKPGFSTSVGSFGLGFGGNDIHFRNPQGQLVEVPYGSAHFLEHKLFEGKDKKVFDRFGELGADFNGGTGHRSTSYFFETAGRFQECLEVLLDFVQHPLITEERVAKEMGIIEQEVRMYEDMPMSRGATLLMKAFYHRHGLRISPAGTVETVRAIRAEHLQACHDAFYRPNRLKLGLAGDLDPDETMALVESYLDPAPEGGRDAQSHFPEEPESVAEKWLEEEFPISIPHVWMGWRDPRGCGPDPEAKAFRKLISSVVLELAFDESSYLHHDLYQRGVIDDNFGYYYSNDDDYGYGMLFGRSQNPEAFVEEIQQAAARFLHQDDSLERDWQRVRRGHWGMVVGGLQSPYQFAVWTMRGLLEQWDPFQIFHMLDSITPEQIRQRAREMLSPENFAVAVLRSS